MSLDGKYIEFGIGAKSGRFLNFFGDFTAIVSAIGNDGNSYGAFLVQGYGVVSARIHFVKLQAGTSITCYVACDRESIRINNVSVSVIISVFMLYGSLPTFTID